MNITGNVDGIKPAAVSTTWSKSTDGDIAALKAVADAFPVPAFVTKTNGVLANPATDTIASLQTAGTIDDDGIEVAIRDWCWRHLYWTGTDETTSPAKGTYTTPGGSSRAIGIYNWWAANPTLNSNKGPHFGCDTIHYLYCGLLAAYGILARPVAGHSLTAGSDTTAEYWSPNKGGWVHVMAHGNAHNVVVATGQAASLWDLVEIERNHGLVAAARNGTLIQGVGRNGSLGKSYNGQAGDAPMPQIFDTLFWLSYSNQFAITRGNKGITSTATGANLTGLPGATIAGTNISSVRCLNDLRFHVNWLHGTFDMGASGVVSCQFTYSMNEAAASPLQVLRPAGVGPGTWETIDSSGAFGFVPVVGQTWKFRAVGVQGNTSNIVTVSA